MFRFRNTLRTTIAWKACDSLPSVRLCQYKYSDALKGFLSMNTSTLAKLAFKHTYNHFAEELYIHTGKDVTKPVTFYGLVNERCNVKCRYCEYWRLPNYVDEMSIEEWQSALTSIKDFVGQFSINFSGGEPFIKPGF